MLFGLEHHPLQFPRRVVPPYPAWGIFSAGLGQDRLPSGLIFANFHFPDEQNANNLTITTLDPIVKIPEYKVCAVKIELASLKSKR